VLGDRRHPIPQRVMEEPVGAARAFRAGGRPVLSGA
jgi:hypothetical protein